MKKLFTILHIGAWMFLVGANLSFAGTCSSYFTERCTDIDICTLSTKINGDESASWRERSDLKDFVEEAHDRTLSLENCSRLAGTGAKFDKLWFAAFLESNKIQRLKEQKIPPLLIDGMAVPPSFIYCLHSVTLCPSKPLGALNFGIAELKQMQSGLTVTYNEVSQDIMVNVATPGLKSQILPGELGGAYTHKIRYETIMKLKNLPAVERTEEHGTYSYWLISLINDGESLSRYPNEKMICVLEVFEANNNSDKMSSIEIIIKHVHGESAEYVDINNDGVEEIVIYDRNAYMGFGRKNKSIFFFKTDRLRNGLTIEKFEFTKSEGMSYGFMSLNKATREKINREYYHPEWGRAYINSFDSTGEVFFESGTMPSDEKYYFTTTNKVEFFPDFEAELTEENLNSLRKLGRIYSETTPGEHTCKHNSRSTSCETTRIYHPKDPLPWEVSIER